MTKTKSIAKKSLPTNPWGKFSATHDEYERRWRAALGLPHMPSNENGKTK